MIEPPADTLTITPDAPQAAAPRPSNLPRVPLRPPFGGIRGVDDLGEGSGVVRRVLADQIKERLLQAILEGRYPPDSRIVELQVSRELGTSQTPVREALRGLEALGVVEISPFRGARVRRPSTSEILEGYTVRTELESLGARIAVPVLTDDDIAELAGLVAAMQRCAAAGDPHGVAVADAGFHSRIVQIGGNHALERVWLTLEPFSRTLLTLVMPGADPRWTANLHEPILAALRARDTRRAVSAIRRHFRDAERMAARLWAASAGPGTGATRAGNPRRIRDTTSP